MKKRKGKKKRPNTPAARRAAKREKKKVEETAKKQKEAAVKIKEFAKSPAGEKLASGEVLDPEEIAELAATIPAPVPIASPPD